MEKPFYRADKDDWITVPIFLVAVGHVDGYNFM